jgi:transcriptional regulator with XRE-family HTH domain
MTRRTTPPPTGADALDQLRELVEVDGRSVTDLAAAIDPPMSRSQLSQILTGVRRAPSIETMARILAALGRPWASLDQS